MMDDARKAEIRARLAAATPGPWSLCDGVYAIWGVRADPPQQNSVQVCDAMGLQNAAFVAAAPNDVADLLAEVEWLTFQVRTAPRQRVTCVDADDLRAALAAEKGGDDA